MSIKVRLITPLVSFARKDTSLMIAGSVAASLIRLLSTIILTRLLDPNAYGVVGILLSIGYTVNMITDVGIFGYVVRHAQADEWAFLDKIWTLRLLRSVILMFCVMALAPFISAYLGKPMTLAIVVYSLTFGLEGLSSLTFATAIKQRQMARLMGSEVLLQVLVLPITILLAITIHSHWTLIFSIVVGAIIEVYLSYALYPNAKRSWNFDSNEARALWAFGRAIGASSIIYLLLMQSDKFVLARLLPVSDFGLYAISTTLVSFVKTFNGRYAERILYPSFVSVKDAIPSTRSLAFYSTGKSARLLYSFGAGGFFACSPIIITLLYDPRFSGAIVFLQILAVGNLVSLSVGAANQMFMALGHTRHVLNINLVRLVSFVIFGWLGLSNFGPLGIVMAVAGMELAAQLYSWFALARVGILSLSKEWPFWATTFAGFGFGWGVNSIGMLWVS